MTRGRRRAPLPDMGMPMATGNGYAAHEHHYVSGPLSRAGYRGGVWCDTHFTHSHEGGDQGHLHPDCGPAFYQRGVARAKRMKKPSGPHLEYVERTEQESTFRVIFVDKYTDGHASAGISRERWELERSNFLAFAEGERAAFDSVSAEDRIATEFDLRPIYEIVGGDEEGAA